MSELDAEICIVGGGLVGLSLAAALGSAGIDTLLLDARSVESGLQPEFDGRGSAIARGSVQILETLGIWQNCTRGAAPILDIRVSDGRPGEPPSPLFLHYGLEDLGKTEAPDRAAGPMGHIIENRFLRHALVQRIAALSSVRIEAPASVARHRVQSGHVALTLTDGRQLRAALAVAAEGRNSGLRAAAAIGHKTWSYRQVGVVTTLGHEEDHRGTAHECFLPDGPFAVLPLTDEEGSGRHRSSLVWTAREAQCERIMALDDTAFAAACRRRFGDSLGSFEQIGRRFAYPLRLLLADRFHAPRMAIIGETAHAIHPIAGQGLNLSLRDIAALAELIVDARRLGQDPGNPDLLARYTRWRRFDAVALCLVTDGLNRLFSNDIPPLRLARGLGLAAVHRAGPLKRFFMRQAMGITGALPRLTRGEAL
ncbi:MAG: UbiH/UbiF/VisC/COQ6 family ubiquinone biosynthesis hydroxylase [Rhodospirillales bacterium]|nr:UbiH/UbiF/VisC/COQ6 family ubiquinone biosynthesis hydroxylase [Rhodospirillales bacterium]